MGLVYAEIELINAFDVEMAKRNLLGEEEIRRIQVTALADKGAWMMCINENIQSVLNLTFKEKRKFQTADGKMVEYDVVGPVDIKFKGKTATCNAFVLPGDSEPLLGAVPMEDLDVIIHPKRQQLIVNTEIHLLPALKLV